MHADQAGLMARSRSLFDAAILPCRVSPFKNVYLTTPSLYSPDLVLPGHTSAST